MLNVPNVVVASVSATIVASPSSASVTVMVPVRVSVSFAMVAVKPENSAALFINETGFVGAELTLSLNPLLSV